MIIHSSHPFRSHYILPLRCAECMGYSRDPQHDPPLIKNEPPQVQFTQDDQKFLKAIETMPWHLLG